MLIISLFPRYHPHNIRFILAISHPSVFLRALLALVLQSVAAFAGPVRMRIDGILILGSKEIIEFSVILHLFLILKIHEEIIGGDLSYGLSSLCG